MSPTADQYNSIQDKLVLAFAELAKGLPRPLYFSAVRENVEDEGTIDYLRDCAQQAGLAVGTIAIEDIGLSTTGIRIRTSEGNTMESGGPYAGAPHIRQAYHPLTKFPGGYPLIGSWVVGDASAGMRLREDAGLITRDTS